ncbi:MAG TPA: hypothetical protein VK841_18415 [Polyangiaceae bacterium]|jgi:hypothetical protein|nr:hypothetical protein [Polyangiaceae bacterium]
MSRARSLRSLSSFPRRLFALATTLVPCAASSPAAAQEVAVSVETPSAASLPRVRPIERDLVARVELGYRGSFVTNAGYNPFSSNDYLGQFSLLASRTLYVAHPFAFAAGIAWDYAGGGDFARGSQSSLTLDRLTVPLEARLHFGDWGYAFARVAPGVAFVRTEIDDPSAPAPLAKERWLFATDVSAGYSFPLMVRSGASARTPRAWLNADGGYGWVANERLDLMPGGGASGVDLGTLALNGAFFRIALAASY